MITGLYTPDSGAFVLDGKPYTPTAVIRWRRRGIARTFQNIRLFGGMTALENVMVGRHVRTKHGLIGAVFRAAERKARRTRSRSARRSCWNTSAWPLRGLPSRNLSYGDQRRLEIARALATDPKLLALDEPAAGMNATEKVELRAARQDPQRRPTILLIEHDVKLVMGLCDRMRCSTTARRSPRACRRSAGTRR